MKWRKIAVTTKRTPLGEEIEAALGEVLVHMRAEVALPYRTVDAPIPKRSTPMSDMMQVSTGGSAPIRDNVR